MYSINAWITDHKNTNVLDSLPECSGNEPTTQLCDLNIRVFNKHDRMILKMNYIY